MHDSTHSFNMDTVHKFQKFLLFTNTMGILPPTDYTLRNVRGLSIDCCMQFMIELDQQDY